MSQQIVLGIPDEDKLLIAMGRLAVAHGNLEMVQIMCLKTLKKMRPHEALEEYRRIGASRVRQKIENTIRARALPNEDVQLRHVIELLLDARCHSKRRNELIHRFWGERDNGKWVTSGDESNWEGLPAVDVIEDLIKGIIRTTAELNAQRFDKGYIAALSIRDGSQEAEA
ncbi:MAG: hypothetical protein L0Y72_17355 [Gemmataceae bacterium]|nr:hypothetical protein [Gemmataceae bacterium]